MDRLIRCTAKIPRYLIELQIVQQIEKFAVLLVLLQFDVVLLKAVQGQFGVVVHIDFHGLESAIGFWNDRTQIGTCCMNFLQMTRSSLGRVALNIITCFSVGVCLKID